MRYEVIPNPDARDPETGKSAGWTIRDNATGFVGVGFLPFSSRGLARREAALREALFGAAAIATALPQSFPGEHFSVTRANDSYFVKVAWEHDRTWPPVQKVIEDAMQATGYDLEVVDRLATVRSRHLHLRPRITPNS